MLLHIYDMRCKQGIFGCVSWHPGTLRPFGINAMNGKHTMAGSRLGKPLSNPCTKPADTPAEHEEARQLQLKAVPVNPI